ncbi:unnamed protein product, partial [Musa textilis]
YRRCYRLEQAILPPLTKVVRRYYRSRLGGSTAQHTAARRCYRLALNGPCSRPKR